MSKMSNKEFSAGMDEFLKILEHQPGLLHPKHTTEASGSELADMAVAFIDRMHELRQERTL